MLDYTTQREREINLFNERFSKLSPAEKKEVLSYMLNARANAYCEALDQREARLMANFPVDPGKTYGTPPAAPYSTPSAPQSKRSAEPADARPGQPSNKMATAARKPTPASQPLRQVPAPTTAKAAKTAQPVKAAPAVSQGTFKISPAEMAKRVNAEADKLILEGARQHVELKCSTPQNQTAQEKKKREQVVLEAAKIAKKLLQKPEHADDLSVLTEAATANVKFALGYPEDDFWKASRERDNESAIKRVRWSVLNNDRMESAAANSINTLRRR